MGKKLTAQEAADRLGYHITHIYRLLRLGAMSGEQFNRVWMIDEEEVKRIKSEQDTHGRYHHGKTSTYPG